VTVLWPMVPASGGGRIDGMAGEVDGGARLAACRWLRPGACGEASK
jgi:hypothetical protein